VPLPGLNGQAQAAGSTGRRIDDGQQRLNESLSYDEHLQALHAELSHGVERLQDTGHLDRIVDKGLGLQSGSSQEGTSGGRDQDRTLHSTDDADLEARLNALKCDETSGARESERAENSGPHMDDADLAGCLNALKSPEDVSDSASSTHKVSEQTGASDPGPGRPGAGARQDADPSRRRDPHRWGPRIAL
jgi:hypothetical protein